MEEEDTLPSPFKGILPLYNSDYYWKHSPTHFFLLRLGKCEEILPKLQSHF